MDAGDVVRSAAGGALVTVRVRPRSRPGWEFAEGELRIGVKAAPVDGAATEEARRALAKALGVPPSRVSLHSGARSRIKVFAVAGITAEEMRSALRSNP